MIGLLCFALAVLASPFKSKFRFEARQSMKTNRMAPSLEQALAQPRNEDRKPVNSRSTSRPMPSRIPYV
jgi:hypothetical protein